MGTRMTSKHINELGTTHPQAAKLVREYMGQYRTRRVTGSVRPAGHREYLGEGIDYHWFTPEGKELSTSMVSEATIGAANTGMNYAVGQQTPPLPEGTLMVRFQLFCGTPFVDVVYIGAIQIGKGE